jgi:DNA mismatch endonuclease (patch repair protein)
MSQYIFKNVSPVRRETMRAIKSSDTKIELSLRLLLFRKGYRYRKNCALIFGKPDIVFMRKKIAIFCDSEFWHGKNWSDKKKKIKNNKIYWINKIEKNITRDKKVNKTLLEQGWIILRFWEKDIKQNVEKCLAKIEKVYALR